MDECGFVGKPLYLIRLNSLIVNWSFLNNSLTILACTWAKKDMTFHIELKDQIKITCPLFQICNVTNYVPRSWYYILTKCRRDTRTKQYQWSHFFFCSTRYFLLYYDKQYLGFNRWCHMFTINHNCQLYEVHC